MAAFNSMVKVIVRLPLLLAGPALLALTLTMVTGPLPGRAAPAAPLPDTVVQASAGYTVYLPIIMHSDSPEEQLIKLINGERVKRGLGPLSANPVLMGVAEAHSQDMHDRGFFSHTNPDGLSPGDRLDQAGYSWQAWGENIGAGYPTPELMFIGWMNSSGHRENMLRSIYTEIGLGYVAEGHYWTAVFATPWP